MTKSKILIRVLITLCLIALILACYFLVSKYSVFSLSGEDCLRLFGCTISEFFDQEFDFYEETGDFRDKSFTCGKDRLVIILSQKQCKAWRQTEWLTCFDNLSDQIQIEVNSEFTELTVSWLSLNDLFLGDPSEEYEVIDTIIKKCLLIQELDRIPADKMCVQYTEKDKDSGTVFRSYPITVEPN